jgi:putative SOS response-associated peptidase YedK
MPVILDEAGAADWMNLREPHPHPLSLKRLLTPAPDDLLVIRLASPLVNSVKNEGPELLEDLSHRPHFSTSMVSVSASSLTP